MNPPLLTALRPSSIPSMPTTGTPVRPGLLSGLQGLQAHIVLCDHAVDLGSETEIQFFILFTASSRFQFVVSFGQHLIPGYLASTRIDSLAAVDLPNPRAVPC